MVLENQRGVRRKTSGGVLENQRGIGGTVNLFTINYVLRDDIALDPSASPVAHPRPP